MRLDKIIGQQINQLLERTGTFRDLQDQMDLEGLSFYHGTSSSLDLEVGDKLMAPDMTDVVSEVGRKKNLDKIFLTTDFNYARIYAGRTVRQFGGEPIVLEVQPVGIEFFRKESGNNIYTADGGFIVDKVYI